MACATITPAWSVFNQNESALRRTLLVVNSPHGCAIHHLVQRCVSGPKVTGAITKILDPVMLNPPPPSSMPHLQRPQPPREEASHHHHPGPRHHHQLTNQA